MNIFRPVLKIVFSHTKILVLTLIIISAASFFVWKNVAVKNQSIQYNTAKVERGNIVSSVTVSGKVISANMMKVATNATGVVKNVFVKDGEAVTAGKNLFEIQLDTAGQQKNASAYSSYMSAKSSLESAKISLETLNSSMWAAQQKFIKDSVARSLDVFDPTYIQQSSDWKAAEAKYKNQQAEINQSQIALNASWLSYMNSSPLVTAPMAGVVSNITVAPGVGIGSSSSSASSDSSSAQALAVILGQGSPILSFNLSEVEVAKIKLDQKATVTIDSIPDKTFTGIVISVDRVGAVSSGVTSYPILIRLDSENLEILPNMSATASIIIDNKDNILTIPSSAIQSNGGQSFVRVLNNNQPVNTPVGVGITSDTSTEVTSGLKEGDEVITSTRSTQSQSSGATSPFSGFGGRGFSGGGSAIRVR